MKRTALLTALLLAGAMGCHGAAPPPSSPSTSGAEAKSSPSVVELRHIVGSETAAPTAPTGPKVASVGTIAPDFELPAYHQGKFTKVKLADFRGKWVLLCFYPGDFTFV